MIPLREQEFIRERFEQHLEGRVKIDFFTQRTSALYVPGREECATCEDTGKMLDELSALSDKITLTVHELREAPEEAAKLRADKVPAIVLRGPANRAVRFFGVPGGNEFPNLIETIAEISTQGSALGADAAKHLKKLKDDVPVTVYVTPTCPYCPAVVRAAYRAGLASSHVQASAVEINEFPRLVQQLGIRAVPVTVFGDRSAVAGAMDEVALVEQILKTAEGKAVTETAQAGTTSGVEAPAAGPASSGLILPR